MSPSSSSSEKLDPAARERKPPDEAGWRRMRPIFTRLYRDEGRTLKECMTVLETEHDFVGTTKMYKNRITEWGLDKRLKRDEVIQMYHINRTRFAAGKKSEFYIRDRRVDWGSVQRFLKRRPQLRAKYDTGTLEIGNADLGIVVRTPSPDPAEMRTLDLLVPLPAEPTLQLPDEIVRITRDFVNGAIDGGIWVPDLEDRGFLDGRRGYQEYVRLQKWYRPLYSVRAMLSGGEVESAFALLNAMLDQLPQIVRIEGLYVMFYIWDFVDVLRLRDPQLADVVARHTAQVLRLVLESRHPLRLICDKIEALPATARTQAISRTMESVLDYLRTHFNMADINTEEISRLYIRKLWLEMPAAVVEGHAPARLAEIERRARQVIDETDEVSVTAEMLSRVALARFSTGQVHEAEATMAEIKDYVEDVRTVEEPCWFDLRGHYLLGRAQGAIARQQYKPAGDYLTQLVEHSRKERGNTDPRTVEALEAMVVFQREYGTPEDKLKWEKTYKDVCQQAVVQFREDMKKAAANTPLTEITNTSWPLEESSSS